MNSSHAAPGGAPPGARPPRVSVVVPSYNHGRYIGACLDSLMFQDYPDLEIVITDDASTDDSVAVIRAFLHDVTTATASHACRYDEATNTVERAIHPRYARPGRRIVFLRGESNIGSTANYNRGLAHCTGEYCTFVPADDICHPQLFSTLAAPLAADTADFAYADMFVVDDNMRILREFRLPEHSFDASFRQWYLCGVAKLYRRELHHRFGPYDEQADADDHECFLRFALGGARFMHIPRTLYSVRSHESRQTGLHAPDRFARLLEHSKWLTLLARRHEPAPAGAWRAAPASTTNRIGGIGEIGGIGATGGTGPVHNPTARHSGMHDGGTPQPQAAAGEKAAATGEAPPPVAERIVLTDEERAFLISPTAKEDRRG